MNLINDHIRYLGDQIAGLTVREATALTQYLHQTHGIEPAKRQTVLPPDKPVVPVTVPTHFDVVLEGYDQQQKLHVVRAQLDLGLREAMDTIQELPATLKQAVGKDEAEQLKQALEAVGGRVVLR